MKKVFAFTAVSALITLGLSINSCGSKNGSSTNRDDEGGLSGRISLSGAFALYPLTVKWAEEFQKIHPNVKIEIEGGGAGKGMTDLLSGQVEFGMISRDIKPEEEARGAVAFPVAIDAVVPTINEKNPYYSELIKRGITTERAQEIWIKGNIKNWGELLGGEQPEAIMIFTRSDACGAAETFAQWLGKHQEDLLGDGANGDPSVATAVTRSLLSIGYNNIGYVYDNKSKKPFAGIRVLPIDVNGNGKIDEEEDFYETKDKLTAAIADGRFPSPPSRELYLVTKGIPKDPIVIAFLEYVLTDGQKQNNMAGYVVTPEGRIEEALKRLE